MTYQTLVSAPSVILFVPWASSVAEEYDSMGAQEELERKRRKVFFRCLVAVALGVNFYFLVTSSEPVTTPLRVPSDVHSEAFRKEGVSTQSPPAAPDPEVARRKAKEEADKLRTNFLTRYLNPGIYQRPEGRKTVAVLAVNEAGRISRTVGSALLNKFKNDATHVYTSLFTPQFVDDGLFDQAFNGQKHLFQQLELVPFLDYVALARERVEYSTSPELESLVTADIDLEVIIASVTGQDDADSVSISSKGAGFKQSDARAQAEERIIKQIGENKRLSLPIP